MVPISVRPYQGSAKIVRSAPAGTTQAAFSAKLFHRHGHVGAAAGSDARHLGLVVDLLGADSVGPDAGRVDDVVGLDLEPVAARAVDADDAGGQPVLVEQAGDLGAVDADRAVALGLAEDREHQADIIGLAVVEEVGLARVALGERRDQLGDLVAGDRRGGGWAPSSPRPSRARRVRGATSPPA